MHYINRISYSSGSLCWNILISTRQLVVVQFETFLNVSITNPSSRRELCNYIERSFLAINGVMSVGTSSVSVTQAFSTKPVTTNFAVIIGYKRLSTIVCTLGNLNKLPLALACRWSRITARLQTSGCYWV